MAVGKKFSGAAIFAVLALLLLGRPALAAQDPWPKRFEHPQGSVVMYQPQLEDFKVERKEEFDRNYMNQLFNLGYDQGRRGYAWMKYSPGLKQAIEAEEKGTTAGKTSLLQEGR